MVGGGQGRTPYLAPTIRPFLPAERLFSYLESVMRVYNRHGRRDNVWKARIKILVAQLGGEEFARQVEEDWAQSSWEADIPLAEVDRIRERFGKVEFETLPARSDAFEAARTRDRDFARFVRHNIHPHKAAGYGILDISLKAPGETPGDCSSDQMDAIADLALRYSFDEVRVNYQQNLVLPHVKLDDIPAVFARLQEIGLATANIDLITDIIACPGLDYCSLANARAIPVAQAIANRFADMGRAEDIGELKIKISGCINACGHHHLGHIGILGVDKKGEEFYQISLGGSGAEDASLAQILGAALPADKVTEAVEHIVETYLRDRKDGERFLDTLRRIGPEPFKEAVYAQAH
jgi:sulfite reductase (NADPH) hemoprotein beta-component